MDEKNHFTKFEIISEDCTTRVYADGVELHGISEMTIEYGMHKLPTISLTIASQELLVRNAVMDCKLSKLLATEIEESQKLMELSANNPIR